MRKEGSVCAKVELEVGGCCPGQMGEKHWGARAVHTPEEGTASQPPGTRLQVEEARSARGKGGGRGESVAAAQQGKHLARGTA